MTRPVLKISFLFGLLILFSTQGSIGLEQKHNIQHDKAKITNGESFQNLSLNPDFGKIPLYFIPNKGQVDEKALYYAKASNYTLWLTKEGLVFDSMRRIKKTSFKAQEQSNRNENDPDYFEYDRNISRLIFKNANKNPEVIALGETEHRVNYFIGDIQSKWRTDIQTSNMVLYQELYPNIDLKVYGVEQQIEYDFVVKPGGEVSDIGFEYKDVEKTRIDKEGNLVIATDFGLLEQARPVCYQNIEGERVEIEAKYKLTNNSTYNFNVGDYNTNYDLIIDPLIYSTYLGGSDEEHCYDIAVDSEGAAYVTGVTFSANFPTKNPIQENYAYDGDIFITKINPSGNVLIYSTFLGGYGGDEGRGIAVDAKGSVYVAGTTWSSTFPLKKPLQDNFGGGACDGFIAKMNSSGNKLVFSTYLGGSDNEGCHSLALDSEDEAYLTGRTRSVDFPTKNPIQKSKAGERDAFITKINASGDSIVYSTYLGGSSSGWDSGSGIAVDSEGAAYVTGFAESDDFPLKNPFQKKYEGGTDAIIFKVNSAGTKLIYSSYLGGSGDEYGVDIAVDLEGAAYVVGRTSSKNFPVKNPFQKKKAGKEEDAFVVKVDTSGSVLSYATYFGGSGTDSGSGIAVDSEGAAFVSGTTSSENLPIRNPIQSSYSGGNDVFISKINPSGNAIGYSTYLGGSGQEAWETSIALDTKGAVFVAGYTESQNFPTANPLQGSYGGGWTDAVISKIEFSERIRIVSWNILDYPDMNQEPREEYFRNLLKILNPDILVVQEMASASGVSQFLKEVLNPQKPKLYKAASFFDGPDTDNALFYKKAMFRVVSRQQIPTSFRDITEYKIKIKKGAAKGTKFKIYSVHFSEGAGANKERENEALTLRTYLDGLIPDELFLVCGSFNMLSSTEKAFKILTGNEVNNIGRLIDPLNKTGKWHDKSKHKRIHTESTRKSKFGGGADGGLDDRYDMFLISYGLADNEELIYSDGSCCVFGNDGKHLNKAVDKPKNKAVSPEIAEALCQASDHLPVIIDLKPVEKK